MFETRDYLSNDPWTGLIRMISDRTYQGLNPSHCYLVELETVTGLQTQITIRTHRSKAQGNLLPEVPDELTFTYSRLDPSTYLGSRTVGTLKVPTNTMTILAEITKQTDITFDLDDFEAFEVTEYGQVELVSKPESLRWIGSFTIDLENHISIPLGDGIIQDNLGDVFITPSASDSRKVDTLYFSNDDFTVYRYVLNALVDSPNGVDLDRLAFVMEKITGDPWKASITPSEFNICSLVENGRPQIQILYSGLPVVRYTTRTDKRRVIVLALDESLCTGLKGRILLHYD